MTSREPDTRIDDLVNAVSTVCPSGSLNDDAVTHAGSALWTDQLANMPVIAASLIHELQTLGYTVRCNLSCAHNTALRINDTHEIFLDQEIFTLWQLRSCNVVAAIPTRQRTGKWEFADPDSLPQLFHKLQNPDTPHKHKDEHPNYDEFAGEYQCHVCGIESKIGTLAAGPSKPVKNSKET